MAASKLTGLMKQGWKEVPEVLIAGAFAFLGTLLGSYGAYHSSYLKKDYRTYRYSYTVLRPDDPKVAFIEKYGKLN